jgi:anti-sigma B factor antagonist
VPERPPEPFRCDVVPERDAVRVAPRGEIDLASVPQVESRLREVREAGFERVVLDLRGVSFLDSSGLRMILAWDHQSRRDGLEFRVLRGPAVVQRVFEVTGVSDRVPFAAPDA